MGSSAVFDSESAFALTLVIVTTEKHRCNQCACLPRAESLGCSRFPHLNRRFKVANLVTAQAEDALFSPTLYSGS